jgi:hypothetical protein
MPGIVGRAMEADEGGRPIYPVYLPLATQIGLDLLASQVSRGGGRAVVIGGSASLRATAALWLEPPVEALEGPAGAPGVGLAGVADAGLVGGADEREVGRVIWLATEGEARLEAVGLGERPVVGVLASGPLAWLRARARGQPVAFPSLGWIERQLGQAGLSVGQRWGVGGPATVGWAALAAAAARADRPDLADRLEIAYRRSMAPRSGSWLVERVALVARARRG